MNFVFISPHYPPHFMQFCRALKRRGARVLGLGDCPPEALSVGLREVLDDYLFVPDMLNRDAMNRAMGLFVHRYGRIDRLDSLNEHWMGIEAQLREDFNIAGLHPIDLESKRSKAGMKQTFLAHDIPCAGGHTLTNASALEAFVREVGLPIILKPDEGVGAGGVFKVETQERLAEVLANLPEDYVAEEFLSGTLMSYDGMVDTRGQTVFELGTTVNMGVMEIVQQQGPTHYHSLLDPPSGLIKLGRQMTKAFDIRERFFHIEMFHLGGDDFRALEVNIRPPGGFGTDLMNFSFDFDVYALWAQVMTGQTDFPAFRPKYLTAHVGRRNHIAYRHDTAAIWQRYGHLVCFHRAVPKAFAIAMGDAAWMIRSQDRDELLEAIAFIEA